MENGTKTQMIFDSLTGFEILRHSKCLENSDSKNGSIGSLRENATQN